jgi:hypothetical protein
VQRLRPSAHRSRTGFCFCFAEMTLTFPPRPAMLLPSRPDERGVRDVIDRGAGCDGPALNAVTKHRGRTVPSASPGDSSSVPARRQRCRRDGQQAVNPSRAERRREDCVRGGYPLMCFLSLPARQAASAVQRSSVPHTLSGVKGTLILREWRKRQARVRPASPGAGINTGR